MRVRPSTVFALLGIYVALVLLHYPFLRLPYFWDEAGYYIPAALDFYHSGMLIPASTLPTGHTPLVMVYLALAWRVFGFSPLVTRAAVLLIAAATLASLYALGRRVASREVAVWSAVLLALSPLFFAQSSLAHLDLATALFTTLALLFLLEERLWWFTLAASLATLSKETAIVLLPVAWIFVWGKVRAQHSDSAPAAQHFDARGSSVAVSPVKIWTALMLPLLPLLAWAAYYHHATGFWTGNAGYLQYNLYSTLNPLRILLTLLRRLYEVFLGGFNWLLAVGAVLGACWGRKPKRAGTEARLYGELPAPRGFLLLTAGLAAIYLAMLSMVGGAILPRYLLPVFPPLTLAAVLLVWRLPRSIARTICAVTAGCFVWAWFINPPCPFPFEDNLAYADFVRLHQQAAKFLEDQPGRPRILTAWPATDELARPFLGYVRAPLRVVPVEGFTAQDFRKMTPDSFDLLYLYSRKWEPPNNWLKRFPTWQKLQQRYFDYQPQESPETLAADHHLRLLQRFERRGQWVRIYVRN